MSRTANYLIIWMVSLCILTTDAHGGVLFESATLGPVGISIEEFLDKSIPGTNVFPNVFQGVRFQVERTAHVTSIGGHFVGFESADSLFGAIVQLTDQTDFPDSLELVTPDVLGISIIDLPILRSAEVFGEIDMVLDPGWYAVVFGSGLFGANGGGIASRNGFDLGHPSYINGQNEWNNLDPYFRDHRFVVAGNFVPEPTTLAIVAVSLLVLTSKRRPV